ncbi:Sucrase/ferredoxin-like-domain-containing protein [Phascolomyces articulosus]|uniref:Sucrase/ferredoxin-like-domain-containing protein n=1 Tax=Phascolomyces articulosus TaxID=60185 RepID=A0AAD5PAE5_9FUNG|nr:Sucrase/ferredoxin-like-domain-containing protein [Phascolomyces articulosus]
MLQSLARARLNLHPKLSFQCCIPLISRQYKSSITNNTIPFDNQPFPFSRFEPCCPDGEASENGFVPCSQHPIPKVIGKKIEMHEELKKTKTGRHLVACVGPEAPDWMRSKVETVKDSMILGINSAQNTWIRSQKERPSASSEGELLTTVIDRPSPNTEWPTSDILVFPEFRRYPAVHPGSILDSKITPLFDALWRNPMCTQLPRIDNEENLDDIDTVVLVCTHTMRDKRCGVLGPLLVEEFRKVLSEQGLLKGQEKGRVEVWGVSHFGGHKFAGNLIIHQKCLGGHMYGNVRQCHVPSIVDRHIINHKVIKELWRGALTPPSIEE